MSAPPAVVLESAAPAGAEPWASLPHPRLLLVDQGTLHVELPQARVVVPAGHAAWLPAEAAHRLVPSAGARVLALSLQPTPADGEAPLVFAAPPLLVEMAREAAHWRGADRPPEAVVEAFMAVLGGLLVRWRQAPQPLVLPMGESAELRQALGWLAERLDRPVGLGDAARAAEVSERTLQRRCRNELGLALSTWLTRARILGSLGMLADPERAIAEVALRSGYQSAAAFTRAFSGLLGQTPSAWRTRA